MTGAGACRTRARNAAVRAAGTAMPYWVSRCESVAGWSGRPAFWPGNSQRPAAEMTAAGWSAAAAAAWRSSAAKGSGTQTGGSPSRRNVVPVPSAVMSSTVSRVSGQLQPGQEALGHGEAEEAGGHLGGGAAGGGTPALQAGLDEAGRADPGCLEPVAERLAAGERADGIPGGAGNQGSRRGGAQPRQQAKCCIPAQHAQVRVPGQGLQPVMQPGLEDGEVRITA